MKSVKIIETVRPSVYQPEFVIKLETIIDDLDRPIECIRYHSNGTKETIKTKYIDCESITKKIELGTYEGFDGSNFIDLIKISYIKKYPYEDQICYDKSANVHIKNPIDVFDLISITERESVWDLNGVNEYECDKYGTMRWRKDILLPEYFYEDANYCNRNVIKITRTCDSNRDNFYHDKRIVYYDKNYNRVLMDDYYQYAHDKKYNFYDIDTNEIYNTISTIYNNFEFNIYNLSVNIYDKKNNLILALDRMHKDDLKFSNIEINFYKYSNNNLRTDEFGLAIANLEELKDFDKFKANVEDGKYFICKHRQYLYDNIHSISNYNSIVSPLLLG